MTAAAEALAISQPALSKKLAQLEQMLGSALFERTGKSAHTGHTTMRLTRFGRGFDARASALLGEFEAFEAALVAQLGKPTGRLRIATDIIHDDVSIARAMQSFTTATPGIELDARPVDSPIAALKSGKVDLAIVGEAPQLAGIGYTPLAEDELVIVMSKGHPAAKQEQLDVDFLEGQELIYHLDLESSILFQRHLRPGGIRLGGFHRIESPAAILATVATSQSITILPRRLVEGCLHAAQLATHPIGSTGYHFSWYVARLEADTRQPVSELAEHLVNAAKH